MGLKRDGKGGQRERMEEERIWVGYGEWGIRRGRRGDRGVKIGWNRRGGKDGK